jgi:3-deoxy-7-phosphoheptulonate synthase
MLSSKEEHRAPRGATHDTTRIDDVRIAAVRALVSPAVLLEEMPATPRIEALVERSRKASARCCRADDRLVVVVGPCSIHDHDQAIAYARRLKPLADELAGDLLVVMRVYFEKPRTTVGWKGYINDPRLDGSFRINEGLRRARELLLEISALGLPAGTEFLDLLSPQYISDLIAWGAIGARTTESQSHRQLASGLSARSASRTAPTAACRSPPTPCWPRARASFMGMTKMGVAAIFETRGNPTATSSCAAARRPTTTPRGRRRLRRAAQGRPARAGDGRLLARQFGQAAPPADRRRGRHRRPDRRRRAGASPA